MTTTLEHASTTALPSTAPDHQGSARDDQAPALTAGSRRVLEVGLTGVRLAIGFEFLWAFLDKVFGLGYSTASAKAWIHGGSPTTGFLSHADGGPLRGVFHWLAGMTAVDYLFMAGLLGVGVALICGIALTAGCDRRLHDACHDVRRGVAVRQDCRWPADRLGEPHRRRPHRQHRRPHRDRRARRLEHRSHQPAVVGVRHREVALLVAVAENNRPALRSANRLEPSRIAT